MIRANIILCHVTGHLFVYFRLLCQWVFCGSLSQIHSVSQWRPSTSCISFRSGAALCLSVCLSVCVDRLLLRRVLWGPLIRITARWLSPTSQHCCSATSLLLSSAICQSTCSSCCLWASQCAASSALRGMLPAHASHPTHAGGDPVGISRISRNTQN